MNCEVSGIAAPMSKTGTPSQSAFFIYGLVAVRRCQKVRLRLPFTYSAVLPFFNSANTESPLILTLTTFEPNVRRKEPFLYSAILPSLATPTTVTPFVETSTNPEP